MVVALAAGPVLVVDDDALLLGALARALECRGYSVAVASTVDEALRSLVSSGVDAVIADYNLGPGQRTGAELLRLVAERWPLVRRVLHSAELRIPDDERGHAHALVRKPATTEELLAALVR